MKRREFSMSLAVGGLGLSAGSLARAQSVPVAGTQYIRLAQPAPVSLPAGKKVVLLEALDRVLARVAGEDL